MDAKNADRSKLVQKQKQQRTELEKKVKKLKGAMKEAAQKELDELDSKHEAELAEFEGASGATGQAAKKQEEKEEETPASSGGKVFRDRNWNGLSKKELEEACVDRGLGKKGSKEDLVTRLTIFQQEQASKAPVGGYASAQPPRASDEDEDDDDEDDDDDDEDNDDEDDDEEDDDDDQEVDAEEMERQGKREKAVQKAVRFLLTDKCPDGFKVDELIKKLEMVNVKGFAPEKLGYKTVEKFVRGQPESVLRYRRKEQMILPPKEKK